jgi:hypothetical protein
MSAALVGAGLGCAPAVPGAQSPADVPQALNLSEGTVAPDQHIKSDRQIMVDGQPMDVDQIRKQLPSRISEADAAKLLIELDPSKIVEDKDLEVQQRYGRYGRGYGRSYGRGYARGFGRGYGRGFYGRYGYGRYGYRRFRYYGHRGYYYPYYRYAGYYYPYSYPYASSYYYPYMYGYGGHYYPYSYWY